MKKSFFKKLSFVLALAMIVSVIAPASGAFAATSPAINTAKKYLYLGETGRNEYDFHIDNKVKGSTYKWSSADENIAVVDAKTGYTTAVAVGTTTVKCIIKTTKKTYTSSTSVIVKDNIKSLAITKKPAGDKLAIGASNDFNRSFTTFGGSITKTTAITKWAVTDKDGKATTDATIDKSGVFTATKAGTYKVVAAAFQSGATFTSFATSQDTKLVLASDTATVTVAPSITAVKQVNSTKFAVTFDSDMSKSDLSKTTASVAQVIGGKNVTTGAEKIKSLSFDTTGKIATVELYAAVVEGSTYNFTYGELTGSFTAAKKALTNIAGVVFNDFNANTSSPTKMTDFVDLVNADGVVIYNGSDADIAGKLTFTYTGDVTKGCISGTYLNIYTVGYQAPLSVKYSNYVYDTDSKAYKNVSFEDTAVATGVSGNGVIASSMQFEVTKATAGLHDDTSWKGTLTIPAVDQGWVIQARYHTNSSLYTYLYTNTSTPFTYVSSDTSKLVINGNYLYPSAEGTVTVVVKETSTGTAIGTFDVVIGPKRVLASATSDVASLTLSNNSTYGDTKTATIALLDTAGDKLTSIINTSSGFVPTNSEHFVVTPHFTVVDGKVSIDFTAKDVTPGIYQYKLSFTTNYNDTKDVILIINVVDGKTNTKVSYWKLDSDTTAAVSMKANFDQDVTVSLNGYNSSNALVKTLVPDVDYTYEILKPDGTNAGKTGTDWSTDPATVYPTTGITGNTVKVNVIDAVSGGAVRVNYPSYWAVSTYTVNAYVKLASSFTDTGNAAASWVASVPFSVNLDTTKTFAVDKTTAVTGTSIIAATKDALTLTLNGTAITSTQENGVTIPADNKTYSIVKVAYTLDNTIYNATVGGTGYESFAKVLTTSQTIFINKVTYRVLDNATHSYIDYEFEVNVPLAVTAN